jgi:hypothetical protein
MAADGSLLFQCVKFDNARWYEVDTLEDLDAAQLLFSKRRESARSLFDKSATTIQFATSDSKSIDLMPPPAAMQTS